MKTSAYPPGSRRSRAACSIVLLCCGIMSIGWCEKFLVVNTHGRIHLQPLGSNREPAGDWISIARGEQHRPLCELRTGENSHLLVLLGGDVKLSLGEKTRMSIDTTTERSEIIYRCRLQEGHCALILPPRRPEGHSHYLIISGVRAEPDSGMLLAVFLPDEQTLELLQISGDSLVEPYAVARGQEQVVLFERFRLVNRSKALLRDFRFRVVPLERTLGSEWKFAFPDPVESLPLMLESTGKW